MKNYGQKTGENSCFSCVCQKFFVPLRHKRKRKEKVMPTLFTIFGFHFLFYSNDHEPIHVHVIKDGHEARFQVEPEVTYV